MHTMCIGWSVVFALAKAFTAVVFFAIAFTKKTRTNNLETSEELPFTVNSSETSSDDFTARKSREDQNV